MESLPHQQPVPRRRSQERTTDSSQAHSPLRTRSEDSHTLRIDHNDSTSTAQDGEEKQEPEKPRLLSADDDPSVKKCWICFSDSTEDTPETSPWRDPCPCALVAHEECLLDWIADTEAPKNTRNRSITPPQILCPQCKSEIKLARPKNYVVEAVRGVERLGARMVTPAALLGLFTMGYRGCIMHGIHSIYHVFGAQDGYRILRPLIREWTLPPIDLDMPVDQIRERLISTAMEHLQHWRLYIGLPLITPLLVVSRTKLADGILPVLPILFFATQTYSASEDLNFTQWPPSASMAFAVLPYVRSLYNTYYQRVWAEREQRWSKEIQPRTGQNAGEENMDEPGVEQANAVEDADDENVFEVRIDGGIWEDWQDGQEQADQIPDERPEGVPNGVPQQQENQAAPAPNVPDNRRQQAIGQQAAQVDGVPEPQGERRLSFSPIALAETVIGALAFPTIAELSGELLRVVLPQTWTSRTVTSGTLPTRIAVRGLLQEKWGRSLVGGCLFVVFKDALMLYVRWKMAQMHGKRRVLDYDRSKSKARS